MGLLGAVFDQLVKQLVQLLLVVVEKLAVGLRRRLADCAVWALLIGAELGEVAHLAVKLDLCAGAQLLVLLHQQVFLLNQGNEGGREGLERKLDIPEQQAAVFGLQLLAEGGGDQGLVKFLQLFIHHRRHLLVVFLLGAVEGVAGVDGVADGGNLDAGAQLDAKLLELF